MRIRILPVLLLLAGLPLHAQGGGQDARVLVAEAERMYAPDDLLALPAGRAMEIAERLRAAVEALDWSDVDPALRVTVSVGVAERASADDDFAALSRRADDSLYRAKALGRNRVDLATV